MTTARTCLWLPEADAQAAAELWTSTVPDSHLVTRIDLEGAPGQGNPGVIDLVIGGTPFQVLAANRPEGSEPTMASSFTLVVADQAELDRVWDGLLADGGREAACGWVTDRFGFSWQVIPQVYIDAMESGDDTVRQAAAEAIWQMVRIDCAAVERAVAAVS